MFKRRLRSYRANGNVVNARLPFFATVLTVLLISAQAYGEERSYLYGKGKSVDLYSVLADYGVPYHYDPYVHKLNIESAGRCVEMVSGMREIFVDNKIYKAQNPPTKEDGAFLVGIEELRIVADTVLPAEKGKRIAVRAHSKGLSLKLVSTNEMGINPYKKKIENAQRIELIIIDPGHGGRDPGAVGIGGMQEKDIVLTLSKKLRSELRSMLPDDTEIKMTRSKDEYVSLVGRSKFANRAAGIDTGYRKNAIFISMHANASLRRSANGFEVYYLSARDESENARAVAAFENSVVVNFRNSDTDYESETAWLINNMLIEEYQRESRLLAGLIVKNVAGINGMKVRRRGVLSAHFYVLRGTLMPAVLVESGFVTNEDDAENLIQSEFQDRIAKRIAKGIYAFIKAFNESEGFTK